MSKHGDHLCSMHVFLKQIGKRFKKDHWIIRHVDAKFSSGNNYGIQGPNGSGKSTLIKIISGYLSPSEGKVEYFLEEERIERSEIYRHVNIATPYDGLIDELSLNEMLDFHFKFKPIRADWTISRIIETLDFERHRHKHISDFSSGMQQRLKLALCLASQGYLYLFDEPTTHLDERGKAWYKRIIAELMQTNVIVVIASNEKDDFVQCDEMIVVG